MINWLNYVEELISKTDSKKIILIHVYPDFGGDHLFNTLKCPCKPHLKEVGPNKGKVQHNTYNHLKLVG